MNVILKRLKHKIDWHKDKDFIKFRLQDKKPGNDLHHIVGSKLGSKKINDYLLAEIPAQHHQTITYQRQPNDDEVIDMLIDAINGMMKYIKHLKDNGSNT